MDLFTREHGRFVAIAKGARRLKSRTRGVLRPFQPLVLGWSGRGELPIVTQIEPSANAIALAGNARLCGFYLNELLVRLLHRHDAHAALYDHYDEGLHGLADGAAVHEALLRVFEKRLLKELGYALDLERESDTMKPIDPRGRYAYLPQRGAIRCDAGEDTATFSGATLLALAREELTESDCLRESKHLMRTMIASHLGGRPLHSRRLFPPREP